jgi:hypothetical protein
LPELAEMLVDDLAAHGVEAEQISDWTNTGEMTAVEALFVRDLLVAGAFGHSRIYEGWFGAVMLDLIHKQSLLMSHEWVKRRNRDRIYGAAPWRRTPKPKCLMRLADRNSTGEYR